MDHNYSGMSYVPQHDQWVDRSSYGGQQHHSPIDEYVQYPFGTSPAVASGFAPTNIHPSRPSLQPIVTTTWPSMLASGQHHQQQTYTPHPSSTQSLSSVHSAHSGHQPPSLQASPASANPHLQPSHSTHVTPTTSTPRRTLTDNDRRKMCQYHEEHPTKKQTEIGEIFGVERSTVSKVLRQKEKYLRTTAEPGHSPVKSSKKNKPDLDRALAKWATNQQSKGVRITDDLIRTQAQFFWHAAGNTTDLPVKIDSPSWIEKFKQKNGLTSSTPASALSSDVGGDDPTFSPNSDTPLSPEDALSRNVSPTAQSEAHTLRRQPSVPYDGLGIRNPSSKAPLHSQSNTSLSSAFTADTGATAFSSENTSVGSPVISPDALHPSSSYFPPSNTHLGTNPTQISRAGSIPPASVADNSHRPRSSTFPLTSTADPYISPPQSANTSSPLNTSTAAVFDSPLPSTADMPPPPPPHQPKHHSPLSPHASHASQLRHPSLSKTKSTPHLSTSLRHANASIPSIGDAKRGLETAVSYLKAQGLGNDSADVASLRSVMMKMQVSQVSGVSHSPVNASGGLIGGRSASLGGGIVELPGGLHRIPEMELQGEGEMEGVEVDDDRM